MPGNVMQPERFQQLISGMDLNFYVSDYLIENISNDPYHAKEYIIMFYEFSKNISSSPLLTSYTKDEALFKSLGLFKSDEFYQFWNAFDEYVIAFHNLLCKLLEQEKTGNKKLTIGDARRQINLFLSNNNNYLYTYNNQTEKYYNAIVAHEFKNALGRNFAFSEARIIVVEALMSNFDVPPESAFEISRALNSLGVEYLTLEAKSLKNNATAWATKNISLDVISEQFVNTISASLSNSYSIMTNPEFVELVPDFLFQHLEKSLLTITPTLKPLARLEGHFYVNNTYYGLWKPARMQVRNDDKFSTNMVDYAADMKIVNIASLLLIFGLLTLFLRHCFKRPIKLEQSDVESDEAFALISQRTWGQA